MKEDTEFKYNIWRCVGTSSFAVEAALNEIGASYNMIDIDVERGEQFEAKFIDINPMNQVPVIKLPNGCIITETPAILLYLVDAHPLSGLMPENAYERASVYRWLFFGAQNIYEPVLRMIYPDRYVTDFERGVPINPTIASQDAFSEHEKILMRRASRDVERNLKILEPNILGPYLLGERFSVADIYISMLVQWFPEPWAIDPDLTWLKENCPNIAHLCKKVSSRNRIEQIWTLHFGGIAK